MLREVKRGRNYWTLVGTTLHQLAEPRRCQVVEVMTEGVWVFHYGREDDPLPNSLDSTFIIFDWLWKTKEDAQAAAEDLGPGSQVDLGNFSYLWYGEDEVGFVAPVERYSLKEAERRKRAREEERNAAKEQRGASGRFKR